MPIGESLRLARDAVVGRWFRAVVDTYPVETARFVGAVEDRFANPVGHTLRDGLGRLYDGLAAGAPEAELRAAIDGIVRLRAVQGLAPSAAVGFVYALRGILREELGPAGLDAAGLASIDAGVDRLALAAFDTYMGCRERLFEIRVREIVESRDLAARIGP